MEGPAGTQNNRTEKEAAWLTSAAAAAATVGERFGRLDALINNAGISHLPGHGLDGQQPATADIDEIRTIFETNFFGVVNVTSAFLPLLRRSPAPRIVNVSSSAGSLTKMADPDDDNPVAIGYVPSKTALTALTLQYAKGLARERILVNAVDPGFVAQRAPAVPESARRVSDCGRRMSRI